MAVKILIATTNPGKVLEISQLFGNSLFEFVNLRDFENMPVAPEDSEEFELNAMFKAKHYAGHINMATVAEDAGLSIPVLGGWPGVQSARIGSDDKERIGLVLDRMKAFAGDDRKAMFVSVAAFFDPVVNTIITFKGILNGRLLAKPKGSNGFGYDPIFFNDQFNVTLAELSTEEKNSISHRGKSIKALANWLEGYYR